jgi:DNA helicase-2/ATP-dependent DNA helicase PcrA
LSDRAAAGATGLLDGLTAAQAEAVEYRGAALLVMAGPGSGKTRTLTARIAWALHTGRYQPDGVLAVTFTRKAAAELRGRLSSLLGEAAGAVTVSTFHRVALLLRPLPPGTSLLTEADRALLLGLALREVGGRPARLGALQQAVGLVKGQRSDFAAALARGELIPDETLRAAALRYEALRQALLAEDLDDLLLAALVAVRAGTAARRFRFVAVDEYQDTSGVQRELVVALGQDDRGPVEVTAIGDPDQAIYAFRGAEVDNFHAFPQDFPGARVVQLVDNFRSSATIVAAAAAVIARGPDRPAELVPPRPARPGGVRLVRSVARSPLAEAVQIVREIERLVGGTSLLSHDTGRAHAGDGTSYSFSDIAILTRTAARADTLAQALQQEGLPIQRPRRAHLGDEGAADLAAYLRLIARPQDRPALWRVVQREAQRARGPSPEGPPPSLGPSAELHLGSLPEPLRGELLALIEGLRAVPLPERLRRLGERLGVPEPAVQAVLEQLERGGSEALLLADTSHESDAFEERLERVAVLTLHGAKGLEFKVVFLAGLEAAVIPGPGRSAAELAEERRLFYVGLTRARDRLYLSYATPGAPESREAAGAGPVSEPSPFLSEIPDELVEIPEPPRRRPPQRQLKLF